MTGRILTFDSSAHSAVDALLPWYVNGTLRGDELATVEQHVRTCGQCQSEIEWLRQVFAACAALSPLEEAPMERFSVTGNAARPGPQFWRARLAGGWRTATPLVRGLLAAQLAAIVVLGAMVAVESGNKANYQTLGAESRTAPSRNAVAVVFDPAAPEAEIRRIVAGVGARIVDGPTSTHAFVLELPAVQSEQALRSLRAEVLVRLAEPLGPAPAGP
jgi:anti-sigma-K factor RskA